MVHHVGVLAAEQAGTPVVLEATMDRRLLTWLVRLVAAVPRLLPDLRPADFALAYTAPEHITHRVDVRLFASDKRRAMAAHATQATSDEGTRALKVLLRLPHWAFRRVVGTEWFVETGRPPGRVKVGDVFDTSRASRGAGPPPAPRSAEGS
jgi:LmbE family N-acetylglucosaminyl deacetylase